MIHLLDRDDEIVLPNQEGHFTLVGRVMVIAKQGAKSWFALVSVVDGSYFSVKVVNEDDPFMVALVA